MEGRGRFGDVILASPFARPQWLQCDVFLWGIGEQEEGVAGETQVVVTRNNGGGWGFVLMFTSDF